MTAMTKGSRRLEVSCDRDGLLLILTHLDSEIDDEGDYFTECISVPRDLTTKFAHALAAALYLQQNQGLISEIVVGTFVEPQSE